MDLDWELGIRFNKELHSAMTGCDYYAAALRQGRLVINHTRLEPSASN